MSLEIGSVVKSLKGRDSQKYFCVVGIDGEYVLLADGDLRKLEKPKRKRLKHIEITTQKLQTEALQVNKHLNKAVRGLTILKEE
ncbi:MAG: KOW domain-containing RNA-binding protein [Oscillospiraceae bacterium]